MAFTWHGRDHGGELVWERNNIRRKAVVKNEYKTSFNGHEITIPVHREYRLNKKETGELLRRGYLQVREGFWNGKRTEYADIAVPADYVDLVEQEEYTSLKERPLDPVALLDSLKKKKK